jgi:hypothetical protein
MVTAIGVISVAIVEIRSLPAWFRRKLRRRIFTDFRRRRPCFATMALRVAINARDGFVLTEAIDLGRRVALLGVTFSMLLGSRFMARSIC